MKYTDIKPGDIFITNTLKWVSEFHNNVYIYIGEVTEPSIINEYGAPEQNDDILCEWYNLTQNMSSYWHVKRDDNLDFYFISLQMK